VKSKQTTNQSRVFLLKKKYQILLFVLMLIITFTIWRMKSNFFYWDEWDWLKEIAQDKFNIFTPHNEHFLPLSKLFYLAEIRVTSASPLLLHYGMLILHAVTSFTLAHFLFKLFKSNTLALIGSGIFLLHPFQWQNVLWTFQSQIILNVWFFLLALLFLIKFFEKKKFIHYVLSLVFTLLQAFCFGNGLILPLIIILFFILFRNSNISRKFMIPYFALFFIVLALYKLYGSQNITSHTGVLSTSAIPYMARYFLYGIVNNFSRTFVLRGSAPPLFFTIFIGLFFIGVGFLIISKNIRLKVRNLKILLFSLVFYILIFVPLSLSRFKLGVVQSLADRYAYYFLIPFILTILVFLDYFFKKFKNSRISIIVLIIGLFVFSSISVRRVFRQKNIVENRNGKNYQEVLHYKKDRSYEPDFSELHPYLSKEEILEISENLDLLKNDTMVK
jgi:hypothetical protein